MVLINNAVVTPQSLIFEMLNRKRPNYLVLHIVNLFTKVKIVTLLN